MIGESTVLMVSAATYLVATALFALFLPRLEGEARLYGSLLVGFLALGGISTLVSAVGFGVINLQNGDLLDIPNFIEDMISYVGIFMVAALLAGATWRLVGLVGGLMAALRLVFEIPNAGLVSDEGALLLGVFIILGYLALVYLFLRPVHAQAQNVSPRRRLLFWKTRNMVLFLYAFLLAYAILVITGSLDHFTQPVLNEHIDILIRLLPTILVFANADSLSE